MRNCSISKKLQIVPGSINDYKRLGHYHYRDSRLGPYAAIFAIRPLNHPVQGKLETIGVIVYTMPSVGVELRNIATDNLFSGLDRGTRLALINKNIRCISRVIIEPRFRGLGLASRLVRETMPKMGVPLVEAMAVMGLVNPFFEKAGMKRYPRQVGTVRTAQLVEALGMVGIDDDEFINPQAVQDKLDGLAPAGAEFIERQIRDFLQSYGKRRQMEPGIERTRYVLSKLTARPVYYIWFNPQITPSLSFRAQRSEVEESV